MQEDKLSKWALIAEIGGGLAVVISLVFVGFQVRQSAIESSQNTLAIEASAFQDLAGRVNAVNFEAMVNQELGELIRKVHRNEIPAVEPIEAQVNFYLAYTVVHVDMAFIQYGKGLITEEQFLSLSSPLFAQLRTEVGKMYWRSRSSYTKEFVDYIEKYMRMNQPDDSFWQ